MVVVDGNRKEKKKSFHRELFACRGQEDEIEIRRTFCQEKDGMERTRCLANQHTYS
jgi:hypothetical protein